MSSRVVKLFVAIALLAGLFAPFAPVGKVAAAPEQPAAATPIVGGTTFATAVVVTPGVQYSAGVSTLHSYDYVYFDVTPGLSLTLTFTSTVTWTSASFMLYDQTHLGALVTGVTITGPEQTRTFRYLGNSTTPTRYYFVAMRNSGASDYLFDIALADQTDGGTSGDAGDTMATAKTVTAAQGARTVFAGNQLGYKDIDDWFKIPALSGQIITATVRVQDYAAAGNVSMELDDEAGVVLDGHTVQKPVAEWTFNWISNHTSPAAYLLHVRAASTTGTPLRYDVTIDLAQQKDGAAAGDAGDDFDTARALTVTSASPALDAPANLVGGSDRYDYYRLNLPVPPPMESPRRYMLWLDQIAWPGGVGKFTIKLFDGARNQISGQLYYLAAPATAPLSIDVTNCALTGCYLYIETTYYKTYHTPYRLRLFPPPYIFLPMMLKH